MTDSVKSMFLHELSDASEKALDVFHNSRRDPSIPNSRSLGREKVSQLVCIRTLVQVCGSLCAVRIQFSELFAAASAKERLLSTGVNEDFGPLTEFFIDTLIDLGVLLSADPELTLIAITEYQMNLLPVIREGGPFSKAASLARGGISAYIHDLGRVVNENFPQHLQWRLDEKMAAEVLPLEEPKVKDEVKKRKGVFAFLGRISR